MPKQKVTLEIKLNPNEIKPSRLAAYGLLLFTNRSWVVVDGPVFTSTLAKVSTVVDLENDGYLMVQLYESSHNGLHHRRSQMLVGAASLSVHVVKQPTAPISFPLTLTNYYFQADDTEPGAVRATCSLGLPGHRFLPFEQRFTGFVAKRHKAICGTNYAPCNAFVINLWMPYYFDENVQSMLPGASFFLFPAFQQATTETQWLNHFRKILLRFCPTLTNLKHFTVEAVANWFAFAAKSSILPVHVLADALTDVVTRYAYRPDKQESFDDVFFNKGGDCEDFAKGILRTWYELERTANVAKSKFMRSVRTLMLQYQPWAVLGAVKKRSFNIRELDNGSTTSDGEAGHMFVMLLPTRTTSRFLRQSGFHSSETETVTRQYPAVILEGTARVSYLASAAGAAAERPGLTPRPLPSLQGAFEVQPFPTEAHVLCRFYFRLVYMFTADRKLYKEYGNQSFLMVNVEKGEYGVAAIDVLVPRNDNAIQMVPDRPYGTKVKNYLDTTYIQVQQQYGKGISRLPLGRGPGIESNAS